VLGVEAAEVLTALSDQPAADEELKKAIQAEEVRRQSTSPTFDEVVQVLLPDAPSATDGAAFLTLRLVDRQGGLVAEAEVELARLLATPDEWVDGPFALGGAELRGSLRACFYGEPPVAS